MDQVLLRIQCRIRQIDKAGTMHNMPLEMDIADSASSLGYRMKRSCSKSLDRIRAESNFVSFPEDRLVKLVINPPTTALYFPLALPFVIYSSSGMTIIFSVWSVEHAAQGQSRLYRFSFSSKQHKYFSISGGCSQLFVNGQSCIRLRVTYMRVQGCLLRRIWSTELADSPRMNDGNAIGFSMP